METNSKVNSVILLAILITNIFLVSNIDKWFTNTTDTLSVVNKSINDVVVSNIEATLVGTKYTYWINAKDSYIYRASSVVTDTTTWNRFWLTDPDRHILTDDDIANSYWKYWTKTLRSNDVHLIDWKWQSK